MRRLRILVSAYACNPVPTEQAYPGEALLGWNLVKELSRSHELAVITRTYNKKWIEEEVRSGNIRQVRFYYLAIPQFLSPLLKTFLGFSLYYLIWQVKAYFLARRLQKSQAFDIFHHITFNNDWMPSFIGAYLGLPFIWGPMGGGQKVPACLQKELPLRSRINENLRQAGQWFWRNTPFRRRGMRQARAVLICNEETRRKATAPRDSIFFFPVNGIHIEEFAQMPLDSETLNREFRVIYAGRLDPIKGIALGIKAFHLFFQKYPQSTFEIIGIGPERERLEKMIGRLGLEKNTRILPWLERESLLQKMSRSDVLLFPSFRDGGGAVVVEAMACGKPVIALDIGGPGFHIQPAWGFKIKPLNPSRSIQEIAQALEVLCRDHALSSRMGQAARRRAFEFYPWEKIGQELLRIYREVLPEDKASHFERDV
jgi:glycosyltransferase involved in cell wall biosynthesis